MERPRTIWTIEGARELLAVFATSALLVLGAAAVVMTSIGAAAS